jgi:hypothetical protein
MEILLAKESLRAIGIFGMNQVQTVVPRLICRQGECVRKDAENTVNFVQMIGVGDGRRPRHRLATSIADISLEVEPRKRLNPLQKAGHKRETICPQIRWGSAEFR